MEIFASCPFLENENCAIFHTGNSSVEPCLKIPHFYFQLKHNKTVFFFQIFNDRENMVCSLSQDFRLN